MHEEQSLSSMRKNFILYEQTGMSVRTSMGEEEIYAKKGVG